MRKLFFTVVVAMFSLLHFTSCEEMIVSSDQTIDLAPKATLSGDVLAELNLQSSGMEAVPAGTELLVEVNYADINPASTGKWMDTIQVSADGKYSVQVPADADGVSVAVTPFSFESDQRQNYSEANYSTIKKAFKAIAFVQPIRSGQSVVRDITYTASDLPTFAYKVAISGKCTANLSAETPGFENAPNGTVIVFYTNDWVDSTTVTNGKYAINAPNKTVTCKSQFVRLKRVWNSTLQNYQDISYKYSYLATYTPTSSTNTYDVDFGEGKDQTIDPAPNTTTLSGAATADSDLTITGREPMPNGTKIYFEDTGKTWGAIATVADGKYSVQIPRSTLGVFTITYQVNYSANRKISPTSTSIYNFTGSGNINTTPDATKTQEIIAY